MIKLTDLLTETIKASEAYKNLDSIQTLIDNKRGVAFIADIPEELLGFANQNGLKLMKVESNPNGAYVVYRPDYKQEAQELHDIAEKYDGYLAWDATEEDSRRIGQLLSYDPVDIEEYIQKNKRIRNLNEVATDLSSAYKWQDVGGYDPTYKFNTGETDYIVKFHNEGGGTYERLYSPVNKKFSGLETGEGKAIPVNATVMEITLDFLNKNKDWYLLTIHPIDPKRLRLVKHFLDHTLPMKYQYEEENGIITITRKFNY